MNVLVHLDSGFPSINGNEEKTKLARWLWRRRWKFANEIRRQKKITRRLPRKLGGHEVVLTCEDKTISLARAGELVEAEM